MKRIVTGGLIGVLLLGMLPGRVQAAGAGCDVIGDSVVYNGTSQVLSASGLCTDAGGATLGPIVPVPTSGTGVGTYAVAWSYNDGINSFSGSANASITAAAASCAVTPYTVPYDGNPHTATGSCTGVGGADLTAGLALGGTTHTNAGTYSDAWSFSNPDYIAQSGTVTDTLSPIAASCSVAGYSVAYDGNAHTATGSCTGIGGALAGLDLSGTSRTNAGSGSDPWTFTNGNYVSQSGSVTDTVTPIAASCSVTGYTVTYDGSAHTATGSCTGLSGALSGLVLSGTTHTTAGTYSDAWTFSDPAGNHTNPGGTVTDTITPGPNPITFTSLPPSTVRIGDTYTVAATAAHGGTVTFTIDASTAQSCSLTGGNVVHFNARAGCMINASTPATANYQAGTGRQSVAVSDSPPTCQIASATVVMNAPKTGTPSCSDLEGDLPLSFEVATSPTLGKVVFSKNEWTYTPNLNALGSDTFTYLALDSLGAPSLPNQVSVTIVNRPARARNDTLTVSATAASRLDVLANDLSGYIDTAPTVEQDPGQPLTITAVGAGKLGRATTDGKTIAYDPNGCSTGSDLVSYTVSDGLTTSQAYVAITIVRPGSSGIAKTPVTDVPSITFGVGSKLVSTVPVRLGWCGATATSTRTYRVLQSSNGGKTFPTTISASTTATSAMRSLVVNATYRFEVRTTDSAGRSSVWVKSPTVKVLRIEDGSAAIAYGGSWQVLSGTGYSGGTEHTASAADATATVHLAAGIRSFALVASRRAGRGSVDVTIDGVDAGTISESASSTALAVILLARSVDPSVAHTVVIRPVGNGPIGLDAILTMQ